MTTTHPSVAIVGGGPGGLTLARLLQLQGLSVHVYERDADEHARPKGATLDLHEESGLAALKAAGLMAGFKAAYRPGADALRLTDAAGRIVYEDRGGGAPGYFRPEIDRGPLIELLRHSLRPGTLRWNSHFQTMCPSGSGWQLQFHDGSTTYADLVIAADGANSRLRQYVTPVRTVYSGITIVEGQITDAAAHAPRLAALLNGGKVFALGDSQSLILSSKGDGGLYFYTGSALPERWKSDGAPDGSNREAWLQWFRQQFAGWGPIWTELFRAAALPLVVRPQYCMPPDQHWRSLPNLTMIGDAAHLMPPYAGEGVNMAMQDALELSRALDSGRSLPDAIAAFEEQMRARAGAIAAMTLEQTALMHSPDALQRMLAFFEAPGGDMH